MSATLTWQNAGLGTKTGTTVATFFTDMKTLMDSKAADANFKWEISASSLAGTPYYIWCRPKSGAAGRILLISWTGAPAGNNSAILDTAPTTTLTYICWFPSGNAASPSNLTASSGTISGDDTNCTKCAVMGTTTSIYQASYQPGYFECEEGILFLTGHSGTAQNYFCMAGNLAVDASDVAYGISYGPNGSSTSSFATGILPYVSTSVSAGTSASYIKCNYSTQSTGIGWYHAFVPTGSTTWAGVPIGTSDILTDTSNSNAWFCPVQLVSNVTKGGGFPIKLRQMGWGPQALSQFTVYSTTGPVVAARSVHTASTASSTGGTLWLTNFKM